MLQGTMNFKIHLPTQNMPLTDAKWVPALDVEVERELWVGLSSANNKAVRFRREVVHADIDWPISVDLGIDLAGRVVTVNRRGQPGRLKWVILTITQAEENKRAYLEIVRGQVLPRPA